MASSHIIPSSEITEAAQLPAYKIEGNREHLWNAAQMAEVPARGLGAQGNKERTVKIQTVGTVCAIQLCAGNATKKRFIILFNKKGQKEKT